MNQYLERPVNSREILWIFDPIGNTGKSKYTKYQVFKQNAHVLSWDNQRDLFYARKANQRKRTVFFDFTRSTPKFVDPNEVFSTIETIKNGLMFSGKYESGDVITSIPHIICMSNFLPSNPGLLSQDRWMLFRIGSQSKTLYKMSAREANDFIKDYGEYEMSQL